MNKESAFSWHWQNLTNGEKSRSLRNLWRSGRAWFSFLHGLKMRIEWHLLGDSSTALSFSFAGEEDDLQFHVALYRLFSIWMSFEDVPFLNWLFKDIKSFHGYEIGVRFF